MPRQAAVAAPDYDGTVMLYRGAVWTLATEAVASAVVALTIVSKVDTEIAAIWLVVVWATLVLRALWCYGLNHVEARLEHIGAWRLTLGAAMVVSAAMWGGAAYFLAARIDGYAHLLLVVEIALTISLGAVLLCADVAIAAIYALAGLGALALASWFVPAETRNLALGMTAGAMPVAAVLIAFARSLVAQSRRLAAMLVDAKEKARAAIEAKTQFIANMSHELRTPLNAVIGFSELIQTQPFGPLGDSRYDGYVNDIRDSGRHLLDVINDILDLSRIEAGRTELKQESVEVGPLIVRCAKLLSVSAEKAGVALTCDVPGEPIHLLGDERSLKQIILNLVSNAVKFTPLKGAVRIGLRERPTGEVEISVVDNGIGMAPEHIAVAMEPFGQVDTSLARRFEGTGLGLPLVKSLTELQDGRFELESELGVGTTACVVFPHRHLVSAGEQAHADASATIPSIESAAA